MTTGGCFFLEESDNQHRTSSISDHEDPVQ